MAISGTDLSSLAIDSQSLDKLKLQAKQTPDKALKAAAKQFESVFLNMMLKSMRDATPQDGEFDSEQTKMFTGMLDQQLAQAMAARGIGLADVMVKQLGRNQAPDAPASSAAKPAATNASLVDSLARDRYKPSVMKIPALGCVERDATYGCPMMTLGPALEKVETISSDVPDSRTTWSRTASAAT